MEPLRPDTLHLFIVETPIPKANNLKVTIGVAELVSCSVISLKTSEAKFEELVELSNRQRGYWEQSREAEGLIRRSELANLFPKLALGFHTRDSLFYLKQYCFIEKD